MELRVLSVGQCSSDDYRLARVLGAETGAELVSADSADEAMRLLTQEVFNLVFVNRLFDMDGANGVDFIAEAKLAGIRAPVMLVSDLRDAQLAAVGAGALAGFGKSELFGDRIGKVLRDALGQEEKIS